jgi:riboflavin-specific deaminase-like protein
MKDDPQLTVRLVRGKSPLRIILDSGLRIPPGAKVLQDQDAAKTMIVTTDRSSKGKRSRLEGMGIKVLSVPPDAEGRPDLRKTLAALAERNISSILVEGGAKLLTSFLKTDLPDRIAAFIAPKIIGQGIEAVDDLEIRRIDDSIPLRFRKISKSGGDVFVEGIFLR